MNFSSRPVIMQVIPALGAGGAEQGCIDVAAELVRTGSDAIIVSNGGARVRELERLGVMHIDMPVHSKNPLVMWRNVRRLRKLINRYHVNVVHVRSRAPAWSAERACRVSRARFMTTCHAPYNINDSEWKRKYNAVMMRGERVIAISKMVADYMVENYPINPAVIRLIHRGIDLSKFHPEAVPPGRLVDLAAEWRVPDGANIVLLPGRLTRWKGHHVLIDAMARLAKDDLFCVIIGDDQGRSEYRKELIDAIAQKSLSGRVRLVDHCDDMPAAYMLSTVVVSASTDPEGFGRIPVEAQAMGRPIVGTSHGGALETIVPGETGWLVEPGDALALSRAIEEALALDERGRKALARESMAHVRAHFTREQMVARTLSVYQELL